MFYNKVHPSLRSKYKVPDNVNKRLYQIAERDNPDPTTLIPVQAVGFADLRKRVNEQQKAHGEFQRKLEEERERLNKMRQEHELVTKVTIPELRRRHSELSHRLLRVMNRIELLRSRDLPLLNEEIDYRRQLETIKRKLAKPAQFQARVAELASLVRMQEEGRTALEAALPHTLDPENAQKIYEVLETQRKCLAHMTQVLRKDLRDMQAIVQTQTDASGSGKPDRLL